MDSLSKHKEAAPRRNDARGQTKREQQPVIVQQTKVPSLRLFRWALIILVFLILVGVWWSADSQDKIYRIQNEAHIESLYSTYRTNMSSCREEAEKAEKDEAFIKENCIDAINDSIIGQWLSERRPDLITTE